MNTFSLPSRLLVPIPAAGADALFEATMVPNCVIILGRTFVLYPLGCSWAKVLVPPTLPDIFSPVRYSCPSLSIHHRWAVCAHLPLLRAPNAVFALVRAAPLTHNHTQARRKCTVPKNNLFSTLFQFSSTLGAELYLQYKYKYCTLLTRL